MEIYLKREYFSKKIFQKEKVFPKLCRVNFLNFIMKNHNILQKIIFIEHFFPLKKENHKNKISKNIFEFLSISNKNTVEYIIQKEGNFFFLNFCFFIFYDHFYSVIKISSFLNFSNHMENFKKKKSRKYQQWKKKLDLENLKIFIQKKETVKEKKKNHLAKDLSKINSIIGEKIIRLNSILSFESSKQIFLLDQISNNALENLETVKFTGGEVLKRNKKKINSKIQNYTLLLSILCFIFCIHLV